jgi:hypothetical protein
MNWSKVGQQGSAVQIRDRKSQSTEGMTMRGAVLYGPRDVRFGHLLGAGLIISYLEKSRTVEAEDNLLSVLMWPRSSDVTALRLQHLSCSDASDTARNSRLELVSGPV